jgi:hypothetical protein
MPRPEEGTYLDRGRKLDFSLRSKQGFLASLEMTRHVSSRPEGGILVFASLDNDSLI